MKSSQPSFCAVMLAGLMGASIAGPAAEIEFSPPPKVGVAPPKPLTERDLNVQRFNFQGRDAAGTSDLSASPPLPSADQMAQQMRAILERLQRNGFGVDGWESPDLTWDDGFESDAFDATTSIDQPRERRNPRGPTGITGNNGEYRPASSEPERDPRGRDPRRDDVPFGKDRDRDAENVGIDSRGLQEEPAFIEGLDLQGSDFSDSARASARRRPENFLGIGQLGNVGRIGTRESEARERDLKRREEWRRVNLGGFGFGAVGVDAVSAPDAGLLGAGGPTQPGVAGTRSILPTSGGAAAASTMTDPLSANRVGGLPQFRQMEIDRTIGRDLGDAARVRAPESPQPTPMELFQRKHNVKLPGRIF
jgi:hypothetical protein